MVEDVFDFGGSKLLDWLTAKEKEKNLKHEEQARSHSLHVFRAEEKRSSPATLLMQLSRQ